MLEGIENYYEQQPKPYAVFQHKDGGDKIFYYAIPDDNNFWFVSVGRRAYSVSHYKSGLGQWRSKNDFNHISDMVEYHKEDDIVLIYCSICDGKCKNH